MPGYTITQVRNVDLYHTQAAIATTTPGSPRVVAARLKLGPLTPGVVVLLSSKVQVRVDMTYATMVAGYLRVVKDGVPLDGEIATDPDVITAPMGENRWSMPHYKEDSRVCPFVPAAAGDYVIEHVIYGASSAWTGIAADRLALVYCDQHATVLTPDTDDPRWADLEGRVAALELAGTTGTGAP